MTCDKRALLYVIAFLSLSSILFSCATTSSVAKTGAGSTTVATATSIPLPVMAERSYFSTIDKNVIKLVQQGSPESLRQAYSLLHKSDSSSYSDSEVVMLNIIYELMNLVWSKESFNMDQPSGPVTNLYTGAIESAKKGIYDTSTGNSDFLTTVLPSLLLVTSDSKSDFYDDCKSSLESSLSMQKDSVLSNYLLGLLYIRQEQYKDAIEVLSRIQGIEDNIYEVNFALAKSYTGSRNYKLALTIAENLLTDYSQDIDLLGICAECVYQAGDLENAENYVLRILQIDPSNLDYVLFRSQILIAKGDYVRASSLLDLYGRSNPDGRRYLLLRAQMQKNWNKNNSTAGETLTKALRLYPDDLDIMVFAAEFASETDTLVNGKSAFEYANAVLEKDSDNMTALTVCIDELIKMGNWLSAYSVCQPLTNKSNVSSELLYDYIDICLHLNKSSEAWDLISSLYQKHPDDEVTQQMYIQILISTKRTKEALTLINSLVPSASSRMKSFLYYQKSLIDTDEESKLADLRSSLTANPRNVDVLYSMYQIYYGRKDWKRAQYYLKQVVALEPKNQDMITKSQELDALLGK